MEAKDTKRSSTPVPALIVPAMLAVLLLGRLVRGPSQEEEENKGEAPVRRLRGLAATLQHALNGEVEVAVVDTAGGFGFTREALFGEKDGKIIYSEYHADDAKFMKELKDAIVAKTGHVNVLVVRADSQVNVEDIVASFNLNFSGAVNADYVAIAFLGGGILDRTGKPGGHRNWSFRGYFKRDKMYVEFVSNVDAKEMNIEYSCAAKP